MVAEQTVAIGQNLLRIDGVGKVTGDAQYPGDIDMDGQLWMKIRFSDRPHARVLAVDTTAAEALPGVVRILTAKDVPHNEYGLVMKDQPVLCGPGSSNPNADTVRCYADYLAVVIAETEALAADAAARIQVTYDDLPGLFDPFAAMADGAPQLIPNYPGNLIAHYRIRTGEMDAGWAAADVVVEGEYSTGYQEHAYLQPEAGLGYIDEQGRVAVIVAGQDAHEDREQVSHALGLEEAEVRIIYPAIGGAFGGREDMSIQIVLALAAQAVRRPVKTIWSREESIRYHHKRHPITIRTRWGATNDGKLVAVEAQVVGDAGAYAYTSTKVLGNANLCVVGPYLCDNCHIDSYAVMTNNIPCGAFRGFGAPQACFAAEGQMNRLADALGLDPVEIRLRNSIQEGSIISVGTPLPAGVSMPEVIAACARESFWREQDGQFRRIFAAQPQPSNPALRRGVGFACGYKNVGFSFGFPEQCWSIIELHGKARIEQAILRMGAAEVGQGSHTVLTQMAAEALGIPFECVHFIGPDTAETLNAGSVSASRMTFMAGNAIRGAAAAALQAWNNEERPARATYQYRPPKTSPFDPLTGKSEPNFAYGYVAEAVEVEVDIETGIVNVLRVICADDVGRAINPKLVQGQVEGAVVQALGYSLMENLQSNQGKLRNPFLSTYLIPTILDVPVEVKSVILEYPDPIGPWGARGMAEMPLIPLGPAIAAAIHDATGVWIDDLPFIPDRVVKALREHSVGG